uniref:Tn3 transposase DDE domain protein n=1 Tax=Providencia rettgeri TaxID=587 RepID=A0A220DIQ4_PRORE|nr:Tn3 transposase DDE domain protein [Providencia rettgeri]
MEVLENTENDLQIDHRIIDCCVIALTHKVQNLRTCYTTKPVNTGMFMNFPWRRAQIGLNKGEAHHALKNALRIGRQGEIRDRTTEGQHYRIAGLNLLTAVIIYWNTVHLGHAVTERRNEGLDVPPEFLPHISPLGWAHILLTGEYLWPKEPKA